jgi:hypothetical protein
MGDCLDLPSPGGVLQLGPLSVLVCVVLSSLSVMYSILTQSLGNTQAAVNYMLSVRVHRLSPPNNVISY